MKAGKTILRARRDPKRNTWYISHYTGTSFQAWSFDTFSDLEKCEVHINNLVIANPLKYTIEPVEY